MVAENKFSERLNAARARGAKLRSDAFVDYSSAVCGSTLNPVTLETYNRHLGFENPFVCGGPVTTEAILGWVWVQHPEFGQMAYKAKRRVFREVWRALHPRLPYLNAFLRIVGTFPGWRWLYRFSSPTEQERVDEATAEIRRLMAEALYGFPSRSANDDEPEEEDDDDGLKKKREGFTPFPSIAFQAQILNTFRRDYGMSYAETERMPMKRLAQLWREHVYATSGDKTGLKLIDPEEAKVWRDELLTED